MTEANAPIILLIAGIWAVILIAFMLYAELTE